MDLIDALLEDHQQMRQLLATTATATGRHQGELFARLREELVRHEVAEQEIVHPLTRVDVTGGDRVADARIEEETEAEAILKEMEKTDLAAPEWLELFDRLRSGVLQHASNEEEVEFPKLRASVAADELARLGKTYETAKKVAPTHPHPATPNNPAAHLVLGPITAIIDRARDAVSKAKSA